jgi:hypothetical protein
MKRVWLIFFHFLYYDEIIFYVLPLYAVVAYNTNSDPLKKHPHDFSNRFQVSRAVVWRCRLQHETQIR